MKVLIVRSFPNKLNIKSYNVQEIGLAKALRKQGVTCDIVFYNGLSKDHVETIENDIKIYWLKSISLFKNGLFIHINKILDEYDIIQVHEYDQLQSWLIYTFCPKKVVIYHGPFYDRFNKGYNLKCLVFDHLFLPFSKKAKKKVTCITKSPFATDFLESKGFKKVYTAGVGLDVDHIASNASTEQDLLSPFHFNALYVGKLEERRNIAFLLALAKEAYKENNNFRLTIIGKFDDPGYEAKIRPAFDALLNKGIINHIESVSQKELPALYNASDIFLFTTNYDIFGMILLESMYFGSIPVSTVNGGSKTLIDHGVDGFIMPDYDMDSWKNLVLELSKDENKLSEMKKNARQKISEHFTWDKLASTFIRYYTQD